MTTQHHEILAWLGDDHGLSDDQVCELMATTDAISERYPDTDDSELREQALITAYRLMIGDVTVVEELAGALLRARIAERRVTAGLQQAALTLIDTTAGQGGRGLTTQEGFARAAGVDRMTVRSWLGLR